MTYLLVLYAVGFGVTLAMYWPDPVLRVMPQMYRRHLFEALCTAMVWPLAALLAVFGK